MNAQGWIALGAVAISLATFIIIVFRGSANDRATTVRDLREENRRLEEERERLKTRLDALEWENVNLMRKLNALMDMRDREPPRD